MYDLDGGSPRVGGFCRVCRIVAGPALVLAVAWDWGAWCAMVAMVGGACGWIGVEEL